MTKDLCFYYNVRALFWLDQSILNEGPLLWHCIQGGDEFVLVVVLLVRVV